MESKHNISKITSRRVITVLTFTTALLFSANGLAQTSTTWLGGGGSWNDAGMWTNGVPDNSGKFDAFVDGNNPASSNVLEAFGNINRLNVSSGDVLQIGTGGGFLNTLSISDSFTNRGEVIASLGGQLNLKRINIDNEGGLIVVEDDSVVSTAFYNPPINPFPPELVGGTLMANGTGIFKLSGVVKEATLIGEFEYYYLTLDGEIENLGTIRAVDGVFYNANLAVRSNVVLFGGGTIHLEDWGAGSFESVATSFINIDNTITGFGDFHSQSFEFQPNSTISPSDNHDMSPAGTGELTLVVFSDMANFAGKVEIDLAAAGADPAIINQVIGEMDYVRVFGEALLDGVVEVNFVESFEPQIGDFFDIIAASSLMRGNNFEFVGPAGFGYQIDIVNRPFGNSTLDVLRVTLTESTAGTEIAPGAFQVTRGTLAFGTVADLAASDNVDVSVRRNTSDIQSVVQVVAFGNSVNAFPAGIDITVESAVFARSEVIQEIYAFNFITNSFELVDARPASRFLDRVDTVSLSGDLTRFVTPAAGNMSIMTRFVSPNNRQQFTANIDQVIWTIFE